MGDVLVVSTFRLVLNCSFPQELKKRARIMRTGGNSTFKVNSSGYSTIQLNLLSEKVKKALIGSPSL